MADGRSSRRGLGFASLADAAPLLTSRAGQCLRSLVGALILVSRLAAPSPTRRNLDQGMPPSTSISVLVDDRGTEPVVELPMIQPLATGEGFSRSTVVVAADAVRDHRLASSSEWVLGLSPPWLLRKTFGSPYTFPSA